MLDKSCLAVSTLTQPYQLRVADESGEDHLYPESCFVTVTLPEQVAQQIADTA